MPAPHRKGRLVVSLHDVSPRTQTECGEILRQLADLGARKTSLLLIPNHHGKGFASADERFRAWSAGLVAAGHEPVLHGFFHLRSSSERDGAWKRAMNTYYTVGEGEFYDIGKAEAMERLARGRDDLAKMGLAAAGFIAPAWLLSPEAEAASRELGFDYTTRVHSVLDLQTARLSKSRSLVWSVRSPWRRTASIGWNSLLLNRLRSNPLLRISIHPIDLRHAAVWRQIRWCVARALETREAITYHEWILNGRATAPDESATVSV